MTDIILGIHSTESSDNDSFTSGHAWLSITENGRTITYGLWPDRHPVTVDNGRGKDIRTGLENKMTAAASRYYRLSANQATMLNHSIRNKSVSWRITNTCAAWASAIVKEIIGEDVDADDYMGFETPRELGRNILILEKKRSTSLINPLSLHSDPAGKILFKW